MYSTAVTRIDFYTRPLPANRLLPLMFRNFFFVALLAVGSCTAPSASDPSENSASTDPMSGVASTPVDTGYVIQDSTDFYRLYAHVPAAPPDRQNAIETFIKAEVASHRNDWSPGGTEYEAAQADHRQNPDFPLIKYEYSLEPRKPAGPVKGATSYVLDIYEYLGGAHGDGRVQTFTFTQTGLIRITDLLNLSGVNAVSINRLLADKATDPKSETPFERQQVSEGLGLAYLQPDGRTLDTAACHCEADVFRNTLNTFSVSNQGITFYIEKYRIAAGAAGVPELLLTWQQLAPYLQPPFKN